MRRKIIDSFDLSEVVREQIGDSPWTVSVSQSGSVVVEI